MVNKWLDPLEWERVRPVLFAVGGALMAYAQVGDIRSNDGWTVVFEWLSLVVFAGVAITSALESLGLVRAARQRRGADGAP